MTGKERIEAAFSDEGADDIGVVFPYEDLFWRDHWEEFTSCPWWYQFSPNIEDQLAWKSDYLRNIDQDWTRLQFLLSYGEYHNSWYFYDAEHRKDLIIEERGDEVYLVSKGDGKTKNLIRPPIGGEGFEQTSISYKLMDEIASENAIDNRFPPPPPFDPEKMERIGSFDLTHKFVKQYTNIYYIICHAHSPFIGCYNVWGFEGMMIMLNEHPELVEYASQRMLDREVRCVREAAYLGAKAVRIDDLYTEMISPEMFKSIHLPYQRKLIEEISALGMKSIIYFTGNPKGKWDMILSSGADAIAFEEGRKGYTVDIEEVVDRVQGRMTVFGNLDAYWLLERASDKELKFEISRQINAGRKNGSKFITCLGSPITPGTSIKRINLFCDIAHELGKKT